MKVALGRSMFSFFQRKGKDLDRRGEEKSPANLKKPPLSNGPDTTSFISALAIRAVRSDRLVENDTSIGATVTSAEICILHFNIHANHT